MFIVPLLPLFPVFRSYLRCSSSSRRRGLCSKSTQLLFNFYSTTNFKTYLRISWGRRMMSSSTKFQRLPTNVTPLNYDLTFTPNWKDHSFVGSAIVDLQINEETKRITLNAVNFQVVKVEYKDASGKNKQESEVHLLDNEQELLKIDFAKPIKPGNGTLGIQFRGMVNDNRKGFFRSKYVNADGEEKYHYVTKFEPTFARGCFPCWDEPAIKATFDVTLIVPKDLVAVSNMPVKDEAPYEKDKTKKIVKFERSVKMSTYVMAFVIGEFDYLESRSEEGVVCRVYTPVGKKERGKFALDVVSKSLTYYKNYFGVPYPLPKMDLLAVNEFPCGAMENWGLVIFRETVLLMDEKLSSTATKQYVAIVTAHETAHMWFGNLVTMEWWSDLWLNEGYATFMEFLCVDKIFPEFKIWEHFVADDLLNALELDGLKSSHPIQVVVEHPASIGEIFDVISYNKGAAVIRMLNNYIGDEDFKKGMTVYLNRHQFGNAETEDLWAALTEASGKPVDKIMPTWTKQMGFPIIRVESITTLGNEKTVTMSYDKFWIDSKLNLEGSDSKWSIPITIRRQSDPDGVALVSLIEKDSKVNFELKVNAVESEWVKLNADLVGYYRVRYPSDLLKQFTPSIQNKTMGPIDRLGLLDDLFATTKSGESSSEDVLKTLLAYVDEDNYSVWCVISRVVGAYNVLLSGTEEHDKFKTFARGLFEKIESKLGWDAKPGESSHDSLLRTMVLVQMIGLDHQPSIEEAQRRFDIHTQGEKSLDPDLKAAVYRAIISSRNEDGYQSLLKLYRETDMLEEKLRILRAFGAVKDPELLQKILEFGLTSEVNKQDIVTLMISFGTKQGRELAWEFFKENWKFFHSAFPGGGRILCTLLKMTTENFTTEEKALDVEKFFKEHDFKGIGRALEQSLESIRIHKNWLERDYDSVTKFLAPYQ